MRRRKLIWHFYPWFLIILLAAVLAVTWYASNALSTFYLQRIQDSLQNQGRLLRPQLSRFLAMKDFKGIDDLCKEFGSQSTTRITVVLPDGKVVGDSEEDPARMDRHIDRPEVLQAIHEGTGTSVRFSGTLQKNLMYEAIQIKDASGRLMGILRTSTPVTVVDKALGAIRLQIVGGGLLIAVLSSIVILLIARKITHPIEQMKSGAERFAEGELSFRLSTPHSLELAALAEAMNQMASQLEERMQAVISQRNEYEAVLSSMKEGVLAVNTDERLLSINQAAVDILKLENVEVKKQTIQEILRNSEFLQFVQASLAGDKMEDRDFEISEGAQKLIVNIHSAPLMDAQGDTIGSLLVLNDVTQVRHLENVRKDFVANVSHELKTPLTAIKGFVETLHDSIPHLSAEGENFFQIIMRQVNRLNSIIEDLLMLSRLEEYDQREKISIEKRSLLQLIENAANVLQIKAKEKNISFEIRCDADIRIQVDSSIFEHALINLLDNAVAYSPENGTVGITVEKTPHELRIHIADHGPGIPQKHLARIFERFYRVDKSRSRTLGGTGLGLAIVKHIVKVHGGNISVASEVGKGSTFTIHHPL